MKKEHKLDFKNNRDMNGYEQHSTEMSLGGRYQVTITGNSFILDDLFLLRSTAAKMLGTGMKR